jgi:hypothetical protein
MHPTRIIKKEKISIQSIFGLVESHFTYYNFVDLQRGK